MPWGRRRGRLMKFMAFIGGSKHCCQLPWISPLKSFKCLKNRARIDVSCSGLTGQTKQILHGKRIWNFSSELWTSFFYSAIFCLPLAHGQSFHTLSAVSDCIRLYAVIGFRYSQNVRASDIGNLKVMVARLSGQTGHSRVDCEVIELKVTRFKDPSCW